MWVVWSTSARLPVKIRWSISIGLFIPYVPKIPTLLVTIQVQIHDTDNARAQSLPRRHHHPSHNPPKRYIRRRLDLHLNQHDPRLHLRSPLQRHEPASAQPARVLRPNKHRRLALRPRNQNPQKHPVLVFRSVANDWRCESRSELESKSGYRYQDLVRQRPRGIVEDGWHVLHFHPPTGRTRADEFRQRCDISAEVGRHTLIAYQSERKKRARCMAYLLQHQTTDHRLASFPPRPLEDIPLHSPSSLLTSSIYSAHLSIEERQYGTGPYL